MLWCVTAVVLVLVGAGVWLGVRAVQAKNELEAMVPLAGELQTAAAARDLDAAEQISASLGASASRAAGLTSDPMWRAAEIIPGVGPNLAAVRIVSAELDAVTADAVTPLVSVARSLTAGSEGAVLDVAALSDAREPLGAATDALDGAVSELTAIDAGALLPPVRDGVEELRDAVTDAAPAVSALRDASRVLPPMLGADGPRSLLLMIQNNAELRTGGGITGSFVELRADAGALSIVDQADSADFRVRAASAVPIPDSTTALYGDRVGRYVQNATMTADFDLSAELASSWWTERTGHSPDAVIAVDPLVLGALLELTGPVALPGGGEVGSADVVQKLLVEPYLTLGAEEQNVYLQAVTGAVFTKLLSTPLDPLQLAEALAGPIDEGRISVWSAHPDEEQVLAASTLAGQLARHRAADADSYAVYFNDATGGKMDVYLDVTLAAATAECREDGRRDVSVAVTLTSTAPADAGELPRSVTGGGIFGTATGDIGTIVTVAAPEGTFFSGATKDGVNEATTEVTDNGYPSTAMRVNLSPGETNVLEFRFVAAEPGDVEPTLLHTPLLNAPTTGDTTLACG